MSVDINSAITSFRQIDIGELPPSIQRRNGTGKLWRACKTAKENGLSIEEAHEVLMDEFNPRCKPAWTPREIWTSLVRAFRHDGGSSFYRSRWPELDHHLRTQVVDETNVPMREFEQWHPSPYDLLEPNRFLEHLFGDEDHLLCLGWEHTRYRTEPKSWWKDKLNGIQFVVPNAMTAKLGQCLDGLREGPRTLQNTGQRRYLVVEFDITEYDANGDETCHVGFIRDMAQKGRSIADINATLLAHLAAKAPLVLAVHSGGKSLHGWFTAQDVPESVLERFFAYACRLGADSKLWTRCQAVRLPDGIRDNGTPQMVKYFNSKNVK